MQPEPHLSPQYTELSQSLHIVSTNTREIFVLFREASTLLSDSLLAKLYLPLSGLQSSLPPLAFKASFIFLLLLLGEIPVCPLLNRVKENYYHVGFRDSFASIAGFCLQTTLAFSKLHQKDFWRRQCTIDRKIAALSTKRQHAKFPTVNIQTYDGLTEK